MLKSSFVRPGTKCPSWSLTVAVTLTSSTPLLNLKASALCDELEDVCAPTTAPAAAISAASAARRRRMERMGLPHGLCENSGAASIDVPDDTGAGPEAHAIPRDARRVRHRDD